MERELVIVLDFGGQYNQLIARRVRECNIYCEVHPYTLSLEEIKAKNPKGIIFTGGPIAYMEMIHLDVQRKYLIWEFLSSAFVMVPS